MRGTHKLAAAIVLALAGASTTAIAQDYSLPGAVSPQLFGSPPTVETQPLFNFAVGLGAEYTDNLQRVDTNKVHQTILQPTFNFAVNHQGSSLQAQVAGIVQYNDYVQGFYGNEFRGQMTGLLNWTLSPKRLNYVLQDYSSVEPVSTRLGNAPSNLQQVNVFVTGPTLEFQLGANGGWQGQLDLRYINTRASKTHDFDSQRGFGALRFIRPLRATDTLSINAEEQHVSFDNAMTGIAADRYDAQNLYGRYQSQLNHLLVDVALGASRLSFPQGWPDHTGALMRASVVWRVDSRNSFQVSGVNQLADSTADLVQPPDLNVSQLTDPTVVVGSTVISPAVFRQRTVSVGYAYQGPRFQWSVSPYYARLLQLNGNDFSRDGYGVTAAATWLISPLMALGFNAGEQTTKYLSDGSRDRDRTWAINLTRQLTPHWSWRVILRQDNRHSTRPGFGYNENEIFAVLYYRL